MQLKNLSYIYHGKNKKKKLSIFSIDIEPFGTIIITSGQDSLVKLWNNYFVFSNYFQKKFNKGKNFTIIDSIFKKSQSPLQIFETRGGIINIIRWAPNGIFFASGGDDGYLIIYEKTKYPCKKKMWRILEIFTDHKGEIVDLAWCPNSFFIITASLDNRALIWGIKQKCLIIKFYGHSTWIKGVDWDISGKYLFTQTENKKLLIWKTDGWRFYKILNLKNKEKNLKNYSKINLFSRSIWSTCGNYLIVCNLLTKKKGSILIFNRLKNFSNIVFLGGKKFLSRSMRSSGRIYINSFSKKISCLFSLGSICGHLSLWNPNFLTPIISLKNLDKDQILDLSWTLSGYELFVCFINGSIVAIKFNYNELGNLMDKNNHAEFLRMNCLNLKKIKKLQNLFNFSRFLLKKKNINKFSIQNVCNFTNLFFKKKKAKSFFSNCAICIINSKLIKIKIKNQNFLSNLKKLNSFNFFTLNSIINQDLQLKIILSFFFLIFHQKGKKKQKNFILLQKKKNSIFKFKFFRCPIFIKKNKNLIFVNSKKNILIFEFKKEKKKKFFIPKIFAINFNPITLQVLDINESSSILDLSFFLKLPFLKNFFLYFLFFSKKKRNLGYFFVQCSGLFNICLLNQFFYFFF